MSILKVGFQGVPGSFSEEALLNYFPNDVETISVHRFEDIFIELEKNTFTYGVLPIENSSAGAVSESYDLLNKYNFFIVGETYLKVNHNLLGVEGSSLDKIKEVYSHPQALYQSNDFLNKYEWKLTPFINTAKSAEYISELNDPTIAAIASTKAAELYNLNILAKDINSNQTNTTRFVIVGKSFKPNSACDKMSIVLSTVHKAGSLYNVLKHFANNNINLLKIESRPVQHTPWEYYFYIDFEGNMNDKNVKSTLELIKDDCHHLKILGNYKKS